MDEVLERALVNPLVPILKANAEDEEVEASKAKSVETDADDEAVITH